MSGSTTNWFWISFTLVSLLLPVDAQENDIEFNWITIGVHDPGQLPTCKYCINALGDQSFPDGLQYDWNRTVGLYRCDGAEDNEIWGYQNSSGLIWYSIVSAKLCVDAVLWESKLLKLRTCNSSVVTQQWKYVDHRLINGLLDSKGHNFSLLAAPPDMGIDPSNPDSTYPLFISNSSSPYSDQTSYTFNFTFVPTKNLLEDVPRHLTTEGLLQISDFHGSEGGISNGGFENSTIHPATSIRASAPGQHTVRSYFSLCGWVIDYGPIDYVSSGILRAQGGQHSIHLNTHTDVDHSGSISQTFRTTAGKEYVLSFYRTGFPPYLQIDDRPTWACNNPAYVQGGALLQLQVTSPTTTGGSSGALNNGSDVTLNYIANVTNLNANSIEASWSKETVPFKAHGNVTQISFKSLNFNDSCGPMIDSVRVSLRTSSPPSTINPVLAAFFALLGLAATAVIVHAMRCFRERFREREYDSRLYKTKHARLYSMKELRTATKNYSSVLGEGGFGTVYKAEFPDGTVGAVKVEKPRGPNSPSNVRASEEIAVLLRVHHRNLVNLIGFCIHKGRHLLVFEYLPNGSLHDRLHQSSVLPSLPQEKSNDLKTIGFSNTITWQQRVKIAADVARGLEYLHHEANPPVVHRDVKSHNILLTTTDSAKLADFGLSRAAPEDATTFQSIETVVRGSLGYLDPQYLTSGVVSPKSDVYSFGVVLLELISGHQAIHDGDSLASWAAPFLQSPPLYHGLVDEKLHGDFNAEELEILVDLSKMCVQENGKMRPNMRQVVSFLTSGQLSSIGEESAKWSRKDEDAPSKEVYHKIYDAMMMSSKHPNTLDSCRDDTISR